MAHVAPVSDLPILFSSHIAQQPESLLFKGRQYGSSYDVWTGDGSVLFTVEPIPSLGRQMRVLDAQRNHIFSTRRETFHLGGSRYFIEKPSRPQNNRLLKLEFKTFAIGTKFTATLNESGKENQAQLCFKRGYFSKEGRMTLGEEGPVIAHAERYIVAMLRKEYRVDVAEGVDLALIVGMVICLDDQEKTHANAPAIGGNRFA